MYHIWFSLYLFEKCKKIEYLDRIGYHYRVSETSISRKYNPQIVMMMEKMLGEYDRFVKVYKTQEVFAQAIRNKYVAVVVGEYFPLYFFHKKQQS